jgi:hypothetical protein
MPNKLTIRQILNSPECDLIVNHILDRYRKGLYSLILVHGLPGTGKSSTCIRIGELVNYDNHKKYVKIIEDLKGLAEFAMDANPNELHIGIVEEVGTLFPSRRSMSGENVDVARILDTIRKKKAIVITNAPVWKSIDSHIRLMGNVYIETLRVYKQIGIVISKFFRLQANVKSGEVYTHSFTRGGRTVKRMYTKMPDLELWKAYETKKDQFMLNLYKKIKARAERREEKERKELGMGEPRIAKPLTEKEIKIYALRHNDKKKFQEIADQLSMDVGNLHKTYKKILKKLEFVKENR